MPYFARNADGDELFFVHQGTGRLETDFGPLAYEPGDYLLVPRGTVFRFHPSSPTFLLTVETVGELAVPDRGMLGQHALFDPAVIRVPTPGETSALGPNADGEHELVIQREGQLTRVFYPSSPLDTVGWKGTLTVMQLNVRDIRPVSSIVTTCPRAPTLPSSPTTWWCARSPPARSRTVIRGRHEGALLPLEHRLRRGPLLPLGRLLQPRRASRRAWLTFHPQGIHHGPQKKAVERTGGATRTDEVAIMIDTRRPLRPTTAARGVEVSDYWRSWQK
jgi:homogentisate 1,2-dioxygenase